MSSLFNICTNIVIVQVVKAIPTVLVKKYCYREALLSQAWFRAKSNNSRTWTLSTGDAQSYLGNEISGSSYNQVGSTRKGAYVSLPVGIQIHSGIPEPYKVY